ncbi:MAG: hypothetical protein ACFBSC_18805 [Microcoleaceae cyanobacterium]
MNFLAEVESAVTYPWIGIYLRCLSLVLLYGGLVHIGNLLGWSGTPWQDFPLHWQVLDVILLVFNLVFAVGLWRRKAWGLTGFIIGIILFQWIPYTIFRQYFISSPEDIQTLTGLVITEAGLIAVLFALLLAHK